jgi:mono/diheme cytochrome c family protein
MDRMKLMRSIVTVVFLLTLALTLLALATSGDITAGKTVYTNRCKMCHGADGSGNPAMGRMLKVEFRPLASDYVQDKKDPELTQIITKGKGKMAPVRGLSEQQLKDVIAYVRSLPED